MYYPDQRFVSKATVIRREAMLPEEAVGSLRTTEGSRVDIRDVVANGVVPSRYVILDGMDFFSLRREDSFEKLLLVEVGDVVNAEQAVAGKNANRGKRLLSPVRGIVSQIASGRVIVQAMPEVTDIQAGVRGRVVHVEPGRGVVIEATGGQVQGVWGNGKLLIASLRIAPEGGLEGIVSDSLEQRYAGAIVVTRKPLSPAGLNSATEQSISGIVAPSMDASMIDRALNSEVGILLTEGFGDIRMSSAVFSLLQNSESQVVTLDAYTPTRWETRTPEVIINLGRNAENPDRPNVMLALRPGMTVRVTRDPHLGLTGRVMDLPEKRMNPGNGLRVPCAQVELISGETTYIPLANLEVLGR